LPFLFPAESLGIKTPDIRKMSHVIYHCAVGAQPAKEFFFVNLMLSFELKKWQHVCQALALQ